MTVCVKAPRASANDFRLKLKKLGVLAREFKPEADKKFVYFPVTRKPVGFTVAERALARQTVKPRSLEEALKGKLSTHEIAKLVKSFDLIGNIAVIDVPKVLATHERDIGSALLEAQKGVSTVCKRAGTYKGEFRLRPVRVIAGKKTTLAEYKESGCVMRLDIAKVYFTPRLSHERERIASLVKPEETVGVWFAGVGPFALVIARKQPLVNKVFAVELNPAAFKFLKENTEINQLGHLVVPVKGDVRKAVPRLGVKFDRIVMALPKGNESFLDLAFRSIASNGVIHFYSFAKEPDLFSQAIAQVEKAARAAGVKVKIEKKTIVRPYAPRVWQVALDARVFSPRG